MASVGCAVIKPTVNENRLSATYQENKRKFHRINSFPCTGSEKKGALYDKCNVKRSRSLMEETLDDSLTSLQWLTCINADNILEDATSFCMPPSPAPSTSSEDNDDKRLVGNNTRHRLSSSTNHRHNPKAKPPYSYATLILMAMQSRESGMLTLREIYEWIAKHFMYYRDAEPTWQNSIRHNLSLNKCFAKIPRKKGDPGKGGYWSMVPEFADKILGNNVRKRQPKIAHNDINDGNVNNNNDNNNDVKENNNNTTNLPCIGTLDKREEVKISSHQFIKVEIKELIRDTPSPLEVLADMEDCRKDHPYGKNPQANYESSEVENIRAIATQLEKTSENPDVVVDNSIFSTLSNAIRMDCRWSAQDIDNNYEKFADELLDKQKLDAYDDRLSPLSDEFSTSLQRESDIDPTLFCLSPSNSDDDGFYDDLDEIDDVDYSDDLNDIKYLTVRGKGVKLFPKPFLASSDFGIKEEELFPSETVDLVAFESPVADSTST